MNVVVGAKDGFKINGFGKSRKCEFNDGNSLSNKRSIYM